MTDVATLPNLWQQDRAFFSKLPETRFSYYEAQVDPEGVIVYVYEGAQRRIRTATTRGIDVTLLDAPHAVIAFMMSRCVDLATAKHGEGSTEALAARVAYQHVLSDLQTGTSVATWDDPHMLVDHILTTYAGHGAEITTDWQEI